MRKMSKELLVTTLDQGQNLKRWLQKKHPQITFSNWQKLFRTGQIRLDGKRTKGNETLAVDQLVRIPPMLLTQTPQNQQKGHLTYIPTQEELESFKCSIIFENLNYLVINKPSGLAVQGGSNIRTHIDGLLRITYPDITPKLVHRIDKDTSGLLIVAKTHTFSQLITQAFKDNLVSKEYLAVVNGTPPQATGEIKNYLAKARKNNIESVQITSPNEGGKYSETHYTVLNSNNGFSLLLLRPSTGRMHQLRVHCASINCPILGDRKYNQGAKSNQLHLHAHTLKLPKEITKTLFKAPLHQNFETTLNKLKLNINK